MPTPQARHDRQLLTRLFGALIALVVILFAFVIVATRSNAITNRDAQVHQCHADADWPGGSRPAQVRNWIAAMNARLQTYNDPEASRAARLSAWAAAADYWRNTVTLANRTTRPLRASDEPDELRGRLGRIVYAPPRNCDADYPAPSLLPHLRFS